jgi:hypothetical protein
MQRAVSVLGLHRNKPHGAKNMLLGFFHNLVRAAVRLLSFEVSNARPHLGYFNQLLP